MERFIKEDTYEGDITNPLSLNLYTYVHNNPLSYWDPSGHRNVVAVIGERYDSGNVFINAANTWKKEHESDTVKFVQAGKNGNTGVEKLMKSAGEQFGKAGVDVFLYFGHGTGEGHSDLLGVFEAAGEDTNIDADTDWDDIIFNDDAVIKLFSCRTGGENGSVDSDSIAQIIATETGVDVYAYVSGSIFTNDSNLGHYNRLPKSADGQKRIKNGDTWLVPWNFASSGTGDDSAFAKFSPQSVWYKPWTWFR
ncbi:hypothetical protein ACFQ88_22395 [Paenibacillus sp. NPDC056579]|uniref:hypothetical protein n=1 Tax=Paenibacillus sp. NPDC056579 TaxID=3345871 RepID=UPI0036B8B18B